MSYELIGVGMNQFWLCFGLLIEVSFSSLSWAEPLSLEGALNTALRANPEIAASSARYNAERGAIRSQYWLDNPRLGLMRENNLTLMEVQMGPMNLFSISQEVKFPTKYFLMGSAQKSKAESVFHQLTAKKLEIRKKVISSYYGLFAVNRIASLLGAQKQTLVEVARSAESRHATGAVPQQDEMKAHVEQTKIEAELLSIQEERETAEAALNVLLNEDATQTIDFPSKDLPVPKLKVAFDQIPEVARVSSTQVKSALALSEEAEKRKNLAGWNFAPDFVLSYKKAWTSAPSDNYAIGIELSVPFWFFMKQPSEYASASAQSVEAEKNLEKVKRNLTADIRSLTAKVKVHEKLLQIYETSLIPQATSTLSSSRTAYQAGRTNFLEFLDSERSLYAVKITYYRALVQYIELITQLEEASGSSLSSLPFGGLA